MRRVLVTGGAGFIGANFVHYWMDRYPADRLVVLDALTYAGNLSSLESRRTQPAFRFVHGDIRDQRLLESLFIDEDIDTVVHLAAESHVDRSIARPDAFIETNIAGTHTLLKVAANRWLNGGSRISGHFHHVSTDEVYGSLKDGDKPFSEKTPYAPSSPYAASKAAADHLVRAYHRTYGLPITISNCSNNFGPYQFPEKLIPLTIVSILRDQPVPVYGDGSNIRDWLYVQDHCRGIDMVLSDGNAGESYNLGSRNERRNIDVIKHVCGLVDEAFAVDTALTKRFSHAPPARGQHADSLINFVEDRPGHDYRYAIDSSKSSTTLGFATEESFESALRGTVCWYLTNESWWRPLLDKMSVRWRDDPLR